MNRLTTLAALALVSALATPVVVSATGFPPKGAMAAVQPVAPARVEAAPAASAVEAPCMRKVKVVYSGPGVPAGFACAAPALESR